MTSGRTVAVIQARLGSTRLPGKVLEDLGGRTVLAHVVDAAHACGELDEVILAIPRSDEALVDIGASLGCRVIRGDEHDVLSRFADAAEITDAGTIVRLTSDCPLLDSTRITAAVRRHHDRGLDYLSLEGLPRGTADVEVIARRALTIADDEATAPWHREHVGTFFPDHPDRFDIELWQPDPELSRPHYRVCVDEQRDLEAVRLVHERLAGARPSVEGIVAILDANPSIAALNDDVEQVTAPT